VGEHAAGEEPGTFGHMITKAYQLLKDDLGVLEEERRRTRFLPGG